MRLVVLLVVYLGGVFAVGAIHAQVQCHPIFVSSLPFPLIRRRLGVLDRILKWFERVTGSRWQVVYGVVIVSRWI
jgi:hypothetical protein